MSPPNTDTGATPRFVRTPDARFEGLADFPFAPHYLDWNGLRMHYLDEGPAEAPVALLLHGEPTWSYLYRRMIPGLRALGYRCVAPDFIGFGRSDKVVDDEWYVIERHCESLRHLIERLDLARITLFVQDWGGPIGLRQVVDVPDRFERLVVFNTWLHNDRYEYSPMNRLWRDIATNPFWLAFVRGAFPAGAMVALGVGGPLDAEGLIRRGRGRISDSEGRLEAAYEAPFLPGGESRAGPRRFPWLLPFAEPVAGNARDQARCFEALMSWPKPAHFIFGGADGAFTAEWGRQWAALVPGATFDEIPRAGHFVPEDAPAAALEILRARAGLPSSEPSASSIGAISN